MATTTASGPATTQLRDDDHRHGMTAHSPLMLLTGFITAGIAFYIFTQIQITSTENTVLGLLQAGVAPPPNLTAHQIVDFMDGSLSRNQTIANTIGWAVQIYLIRIAFPLDRLYHLMHKKHNKGIVTPSLAARALWLARLQTWITVILIGGEVLTDAVYVLQGHELVSGVSFGVIPTVHDAGALLIAFLFPLGLCSVTVFSCKAMFVCLEALIERLRERKAPAATA